MKNKRRLLWSVAAVMLMVGLMTLATTPRATHAAAATMATTSSYHTYLYPGNTLYGNSNDYVYNASSGAGPYKLVMQSDGNLVMYDPYGHAVWANGRNGYMPYASYEAVMQWDGNFVEYCYGGYDSYYGTSCGNGVAIWATGTYKHNYSSGSYLINNGAGDFAIYSTTINFVIAHSCNWDQMCYPWWY